MRLLLIGDAFDQYTMAFSSFLKQYDPTVTVHIINSRLVSCQEANRKDFSESYDKIYKNGFISKSILRIPIVRGLMNFINKKKILYEVNKTINTYDVICLQGFWDSSLNIYNKLHNEGIFTVGAIYGSDFYRRNTRNQMLFKAFDRCNRILVSSNEMINDIKSVYNLPIEKIRKCIFGLEPLETLILMKQVPPSIAKAKFDLKTDDFVITCGYNGSPFQEHFKIIDQLIAIKAELPSSYILLFPITYGGSKNYILSIKEKLESSGLNYLLIEDYLSDEEVSLLRLITDIFIQVQKTDALSGSMREHLFAQNVVITGKWLPYGSLLNDGIYFETINNLDELGETIVDTIENYSQYKGKAIFQNTSDKFERFRWPISIKDWHETLLEYKKVKND